jgi:DNA topoisomerase I
MTQDDALETADAAGLRYVNEDMPCIRRRRRGKGWEYTGPDGKRITDPKERQRIAGIVIPPAWKDVWICPRPDGHILAVGRDARGRKQYKYHPRWREVRDETKFHRLTDFGTALPDIRARTDKDLSARGLPREKVLALVVRLLDRTLIRVGNEEYAEENDAYGLTTLRHDHVEVNGSTVVFDFTGKGGAEREVALRDQRLARIVHQCHELGGQELFAYEDESGEVVDVGSAEVNDYLRDLTSDDFSAKEFRTWGGTVAAARTLVDLGEAVTKKEAEKNVLAAVDAAAERLGNTRAVCRSSYVHPAVPEAYLEGELLERWRRTRRSGALGRGERTVLAVLKDRV